jgi:hypothetical protein
LLENRTMTQEQLDRLRSGRIVDGRLIPGAEVLLQNSREGIRKTRREIEKIHNNSGEDYVGIGHYQERLGAPAIRDEIGRVIKDAVPEATRSVGANVFLVAPGMDVQREVDDTDESYAEKQAEASARWFDIRPSPGQELTPEELAENARRQAARREHYIRSKAVSKAIADVVETYVEDAYIKASNTQENFIEFNPLKVIQEAVNFAKAEQDAIDMFFKNAADDAAQARMAGMHAGAIALLTDPSDGMAMKLLSASEKGRVSRIRLPDNHAERVEKIGRLYEMDGETMVLLPVDARERLMRAYPKTITPRNVDSTLKGMVLDALPIRPSRPSTLPTNTDFSYFLNGAEKKKAEAFNDTSFSLTKDPALTRGESAKLFRDRWFGSMQRMLNRLANESDAGTKTVDLSGDNSQKAINEAGYMLEMLVVAHNDPGLSEQTKKEVFELLRAIDLNVIETRSYGLLGIETAGINSVRILATFSKAFSEIEAAAIQKRLIAGMSLTGKGRELELGLLKMVHHQDARIRHRFMKNYAAREAAKHLNAFLDYGISISTGRRGYEISKKAASEKIGKAAEKVGSNSLNHTLGYLMAVVRGIDNAHGMGKKRALNELVRVMGVGFLQLDQFIDAQDNYYGNKVSKYWNGHSLDLGRDLDLAKKVRVVLNKSNLRRLSNDARTDADAQVAINSILKELEAAIEDDKTAEVKAYADTIHGVMTDIHNAMQFTMAVLSQEDQTDVPDADRQNWRDAYRNPFKQTYSSVPLRLSYALHPDPKFMGKSAEGRYVSDPADIVSFGEASFFGGIGRNEMTGARRNIYRPIAINGLSSPLALVDDSLYRLNVTPTYEVLRRSFGKTVNDHGIPTVKDGHFLEKIQSMAPNDPSLKTHFDDLAKHEEDMFDFQKAMAGVTIELETQLQNDASINVDNTGGAEAIRFLGSAYIVRALASPLQLWDQTASPSVGYSIGKLVTGKARMAGTYFQIVGKIMASIVTDRKYWRQVRAFIQDVEPATYWRSADGQDVAKDMLGSQVRYGKKKGRNLVGKGFRKYEQIGEKALSLTIGSGERVIASAVFLTELMELMGNHNLDQILGMDKAGRDAIPMMAKNNARVKVNDLMSQSDQSKKAGLFQTKTSSPTRNALMRSLTRFSNHTAGVGSNASVLSVPALDPLLGKINSRKWGDVDKESQQEAMENVVQTLVQNVLFYPLKLKIMIPLILSVMLNSWGGDDDDEAIREAQELANKLLAPTDDGHWLANLVKGVLFGKKRELFQSNKSDEAARSSALAEVLTRSLLEGFQVIPVFGAIGGYAPASGLLQVAITDPLSEDTAAMLTGVEKSLGPYSGDDTTIRPYQKGWDENMVSAAAPAMMVYDWMAALKLAAEYNFTTDAEAGRGRALLNTSAYLATELIPFARESRAWMKGLLKESVYKDN